MSPVLLRGANVIVNKLATFLLWWDLTVEGEPSTLEKRLSNSLLLAIQEHLHMSARQVENAHNMASSSVCVSWTYMKTHELHQDVGWIALESHQHLPAAKTSALASPRIHCETGHIRPGSPLWRDLTKVISVLNWRYQDWHKVSLPWSEPRPPRWEAKKGEGRGDGSWLCVL